MSTQPNTTPDDIASTALELWDMLAEESEDADDLCSAVQNDLVKSGLPEVEAARVAAMANFAFNTVGMSANESNSDGGYAADPIYQARIKQLQGGEWDV